MMLDGAGVQLTDDVFEVRQNGEPGLLDVLANDMLDDLAPGERRIVAISYGSQGGRIEVSEDGLAVRYAPPPDFAGVESFRYFAGGSSAGVSVRINSPLADDEYRDVIPREETLLDVLANDSFWDGYLGERRITFVTAATQGSEVSIADDGRSLLYTSAIDARGNESFVYVVDGQYNAKVTLSILHPFPTGSHRDEVIQNSQQNVIDVMSDAQFWSSYDGPRQISTIVDANTRGEVTIAEGGRAVIFTPAENFSGYDSFTIIVDASFERQVLVKVHRPVRDDNVTIDRDSSHFVIRPLANDTYRDLDRIERRIVERITSVGETSEGGLLEISPDGQSVFYTAPAGFLGRDSFEYIADGKYPAQVNVNVTMPVRDDRLDTLQDIPDQTLPVMRNDFSGNGYDGPRIITWVSQTEIGTVSIAADGKSLRFSPLEGFTGSDTLTYVVDGDLTASVRLNVQPLAVSDSYRLLAGGSVGRYQLNVMENDRFGSPYPGAGVITGVGVSENGGQVTIAVGGRSLWFEPAVGFDDRFTYTVDGKYEASVRVRAKCNPLTHDRMVVDRNSQGNSLDVSANDLRSAYCDHAITGEITAVGPSTENGQVSISADGLSVIYTPPEDFVGTDSFIYTADGVLQQSVSVTVVRRARDDEYRVDPDSTNNELRVLINDLLAADYQGAGWVTSLSGAAEGAVLEVAADGRSVLYTPPAGFVGTDTFEYRVDGVLSAEVTVLVQPSVEQALPQFGTQEQFEQFIVDDAIARYGHLFGQPFFQPIFFIMDGPAVTFGLDAAERSHSETNVQVAGVDEGDIIEFDDTYLYALTGGELVITRAWPADEMEVVSRVIVEGSPLVEYLRGDRLTVISQEFDNWRVEIGPLIVLEDVILPEPQPRRGPATIITVFDISDRAAPVVVQETHLDGSYAQSRAIDEHVFVMLNTSNAFAPRPLVIEDEEPDDGDDNGDDGPLVIRLNGSGTYQTQEEYVVWLMEDRDRFMRSVLPEYMSYDADGELVASGLITAPADIFLPLEENSWSLLTVASINVASDEPGVVSATSVYTQQQATEYASLNHLYLFQNSGYGETAETSVLKYRWDGQTGQVLLVASGQLPGRLLDQFSADEYQGHLRVAATITYTHYDNRPGTSENDLFVLADSGGVLELVGGLKNLGVDQSIRSVRFMGSRALASTFDNSDPLLAFDLSDPTEPLLAGYLTVPGLSDYMQMIDADHLLTVGRNTPDGVNGPAQVSLFDISDMSRPLLVDEFTMPRFSTTEAAADPHAFGYFAEHDLLAVPVRRRFIERTDEDGDGFRETSRWTVENELLVLRIDPAAGPGAAIELLASIQHDSPVRRSGYIDDVLYSIAEEDVKAVRVADPNTVIGQVTLTAPEDPPNPMPADLDGDGFVDFRDLTLLLANWNRPGAARAEGNLVAADTTPVNFSDLTALLSEWTGPGPVGGGQFAVGVGHVPGSEVASQTSDSATRAAEEFFSRLDRTERTSAAQRRTARRDRASAEQSPLRRLQAVDRAMEEKEKGDKSNYLRLDRSVRTHGRRR